MASIHIAKADEEIARCFSVMAQLRSHLTEKEFVTRVKRQQDEGYTLVYIEDKEEVKSVAGFRTAECLAWGKFMYVDDLVTADDDQGKGYGSLILDSLVDYAKDQDCEMLHLDSGVQRFAAHRFYFKKGLELRSFHFSMPLNKT